MANAAYDFKKGRFFILSMEPNGPNRLEGHTSYNSRKAAENAAKRYLEDGYKKTLVIICEVSDLVGLNVSTELTSKSA